MRAAVRQDLINDLLDLSEDLQLLSNVAAEEGEPAIAAELREANKHAVAALNRAVASVRHVDAAAVTS